MTEQLFNAIESGNLEKVKYMANIQSEEHNLAVICASGNGHLEMVKYLVSLGADIGSDDNQSVKCASRNGHLEIVKYLVSLGADIRSENDISVRWASENGHRLIIIKHAQQEAVMALVKSLMPIYIGINYSF